MESLPLFISFSALMIWSLVVLFWPGNLKTATRGVGLGFSLIQLGAAIWAAARTFSDTSGVKWSGVWFRLNATDVFEVKFLVDPIGMVLWVTLSLVVVVAAYFALLNQVSSNKTLSRGETIAVPLLALGAVITVTSANFIAYNFGWSLIAFVGFLAIGMSLSARDERSRASFRYILLNIVPEILFASGLLGCYVSTGTMSFAELNEKAGAVIPSWAVICLMLGTMLRNMQIPLMQCARYVASAKSAAYPIFFVGHVIVSATIFTKIYPVIVAVPGIEYFAILPAITALAAAILALPEEEPATFIGWLACYLGASVFLSGLVGDYQAAEALAFTGAMGGILLASSLAELPIGEPGSRWFAIIAVFVLTGFPLSGWGWARYLEYLGLLQVKSQQNPVQWVVLGIKLLADILMGLALWGMARERWLNRETSTKVRWEVVLPLSVLVIACLSAAVGGRPFGGMAGGVTLEHMPEMVWFERLVNVPAGAGAPGSNAMEIVGSDVDILTRVLVMSVFALPAILASLWLYRDMRVLGEFRAGCRRVLDKVTRSRGTESFLWRWFFRPLNRNVGRAATFFDTRVVDYVFSDMWLKPARLVRRAFSFLENAVIDRKLIDGLGEAVATIGKSLRIVQNGQVQFYFALGLLLMGAIVVKFIVVGG